MKITWLGHSGFRIEIGNQILLVDPWLTGNPVFPQDKRAEAIVGRLVDSFGEQVALPKPPAVTLGFSEIPAGPNPPLLRDVLLEAFPARSR